MSSSVPPFESDLRLSARTAIAALVALGVVLVIASQDVNPQPEASLYAVLLFGTGAVVWLLNEWQPRVGRWLLIASLIALVYAGQAWLPVPGFMCLMALPTLLAAPLIGVRASLATAAVATGLILSRAALGGTGAEMGIPLVAVWGVFLLAWAIYRPVYIVAHWAWEYYGSATRLLAETQERQAELERVLEDQARANLQLARLNALTQRLRGAADEARVAKEQFVANVSHELRTPLNMIVGFADTILQSPETYGGRIPPALMADLAVIQRNAAHLSHLIDDVLDLSQIDAGQMALVREHVDLGSLVVDAATAVRPLYESRNLVLLTEVASGLPPVFCDGTRIREVLLNLLSNAGRFTERGAVRVRAWPEGDDVMVAVADSGPGIAAEDLSKLFVPFQQLDGSIQRRYGGTGLGLAISRQFIELHGGRIWVESWPGSGTTFYFRLPVSPPAPPEPGYRRGILPGWEYLQHDGQALAPKARPAPRIMVTEEGDALRRLMERHLAGVDVAFKSTLEAGLAEIAQTPTQALVVNDVSVTQVLERLITSDYLPPNTLVLVCSVPGPRQASEAAGASVRLVKPVSGQDLLQALDRVGVTHGTILIADDEPDALQLFGRMLASSGRQYRVLLARDGEEALEIVGDCPPDVIILDLVMPNMGGFALLAALQADERTRCIPAIVVSALDTAGQPIVSSALAVTRAGGLSAQQLLRSLSLLIQALGIPEQAGDPAPPAVQSAPPASG